MAQGTLDFVTQNTAMLKRKGMITKHTVTPKMYGGVESVEWTFYLYDGRTKVCRSTFEAKEWIIGVLQGIYWFYTVKADYHSIDILARKYDINEN